MDSSPPSFTSIRRSRVLLAVGIFAGALYFFGAPWNWSMSTTLNESSGSASYFSRSSRKPIVDVHHVKEVVEEPVDEIYGLLHLVTRSDGLQLRDDMDVDLNRPLAMEHYSAGDAKVAWGQVKREFESETPIVIFSKTYCPYSKRAKALLEQYDLSPPPKIVEVDLRSDGHIIKQLLMRLTDRGTFPNVVVQGKSIGGSDDVADLHAEGRLKGFLEAAGVSVRGKV
ncbi:hypothetical protein HGRIS_002962 [Hohenbuehelia grisea]|uniref:Glutaredoxin domain-containing protein n=1 Tax=Hohenbuehelia grisea TaxID=104357 RepID=A0ABR3JM15_9AGAR